VTGTVEFANDVVGPLEISRDDWSSIDTRERSAYGRTIFPISWEDRAIPEVLALRAGDRVSFDLVEKRVDTDGKQLWKAVNVRPL